jgi:hypothetical protein
LLFGMVQGLQILLLWTGAVERYDYLCLCYPRGCVLIDGLCSDNTNADVATREAWISLAKEHNVPVRCVYFTAPPALCKHNDTVRAFNESVSSLSLPFPFPPHSQRMQVLIIFFSIPFFLSPDPQPAPLGFRFFSAHRFGRGSLACLIDTTRTCRLCLLSTSGWPVLSRSPCSCVMQLYTRNEHPCRFQEPPHL